MKYRAHTFSQPQNFFEAKNANIVTENRNILWFNTDTWGGEDNGMAQFLINLRQVSSIHANILNLKYTLIKADGLEIRDETQPNANELSKFIEKRNKSGDNLKAVYDKCAMDMSWGEAACIQVLFDYNGSIAEIYHVPLEDVRMEAPNQYGYIENYYISKNWAKISNTRNKKVTANNSAVKIRAFDPSLYLKHPVQLLYIKKYSPSTYYSIPTYVAAIDAILTDGLLVKHQLSNLQSKYFINGMLVQQGQGITEKDMDDFISEFNALYQNPSNRNRMMFSWVDNMAEQKPDFVKFTEENGVDFFEKLKNKIEEIIIQAHNAYPEASGKITKSADLGGQGNALFVSTEAFNQLVCNNLQDTLLGGFNRVLEINQYPTLAVSPLMLRVQQPQTDGSELTTEEKRWIVWGLETEQKEENDINTEETANQ